MGTTIYSKEDKDKLGREFDFFNLGFVSFFVGQLIISLFKLCSLRLWFYGIIVFSLVYWCTVVFKRLDTSNKILFCIVYGTLLGLIFLSFQFSGGCN